MTDNFFPWDEILDTDLFPAGHIQFQVDSLEDSESSGGKRMFRAQFTAVAPVEVANMRYFENYVTGTDEALTSIVPGSFGTKQLKAFLKNAQVPPSNDPAMLCAGATNTQFIGRMTVNKEGENQLRRYFRVGEKPPALDPVKPAVGGAGAGPVAMPVVSPPVGGSTPPPAPKGAPPVPETAAEAPKGPPLDKEPASTVVAPTGPPAPTATIPAPTTVVAPGPAAGAAGAPSTPAVVAPGPTTPASPTSTTAPGPPTPTMECSICKTQIPVLEFSAHVQSHGG